MIPDVIELYAFEKITIKKYVSDTNCVYFLHSINMDIKYIGQTNNLRLRLFSHFKEGLFEDIKFITYIQIDDKQSRKKIEQEMIYRIKPELNKRFIHYEPK